MITFLSPNPQQKPNYGVFGRKNRKLILSYSSNRENDTHAGNWHTFLFVRGNPCLFITHVRLSYTHWCWFPRGPGVLGCLARNCVSYQEQDNGVAFILQSSILFDAYITCILLLHEFMFYRHSIYITMRKCLQIAVSPLAVTQYIYIVKKIWSTIWIKIIQRNYFSLWQDNIKYYIYYRRGFLLFILHVIFYHL